MKRSLIVATVAGGLAALTGAVVTAVPSLAQSSTKSLSFVAVQTANHNFDKTHSISADKDKSNGNLIGTDTLSCVASSSGDSARCNVAAGFKGGILYGTFTIDFADGSLAGKVTGGTRHFDG